MKHIALAALVALSLSAGAAQAQSSTGTSQKPAAQKTTAKKAPAKSTAKKGKTSSKTAAKRAAPAAAATAAAAAVAVPSKTLGETELNIAKQVQTGKIQCELGADVTVTADEKNPGFFHVSAGKQSYYMHPVESRTGAVRIEDERAGAMWLQLGNKSMLLSQKLGQRVADECATPTQREFAAQMRATPQPGLLDAAPQR